MLEFIYYLSRSKILIDKILIRKTLIFISSIHIFKGRNSLKYQFKKIQISTKHVGLKGDA